MASPRAIHSEQVRRWSLFFCPSVEMDHELRVAMISTSAMPLVF